LTDVDAVWRPCKPDTIGACGWFNVGFSAVAYFFGRALRRRLNVPVGLVNTSWGGTQGNRI
jgi:sialate O-acetylesterase